MSMSNALIEERVRAVAAKTAAELERHCAESGVATANEQKQLQPCCTRATRQLAAGWEPTPALTSKRFGDTLGWVGLGSVDVVLRWPDHPPTFIELKCGAAKDTLGPCSWDALKLASGVLAGNACTGYLLAGLPTALWETETLGHELFNTRDWTATELRELFLSWWRYWEKETTPHVPGRVAESFTTFAVGSFPLEIGGSMWELRLARVEPSSRGWLRWRSTLEPPDDTESTVQRAPRASDPLGPAGGVGRSARIAGCLLGGAVGDMLGAPIEFMSLTEIRERFGAAGLQEPVAAYGRVGAITDDTQMSLFTAEGILRAHNRLMSKGIASVESCVRFAYKRWLYTQDVAVPEQDRFGDPWPDGWLIGHRELHARRAPGNTCLSALADERHGSIDEPLNHSKGCGAVMRAAPIGLFPFTDPFSIGAELGALTHGHPSGYLGSGYLSALVAALREGAWLDRAIEIAEMASASWDGADEIHAAVGAALALAERSDEPTPELIESLGAGWVSEEALAIALYCTLVARDFEHGVLLAVNHSGDSDSTGAITGNLLGTLLGARAIPERWLSGLELRDVIEQIGADIDRHHEPFESEDPWSATSPDWDRYPGW
jgi:ADP-ribosylglycohydrolase